MDFDQFDEQFAGRLLGTATAAGGISEYLGFRHTELSAGHLTAEMEVGPDLLTPFGNLHGGCLSAFVDHCLGVVFYPVIPSGAWVATTEFKLNLLRPVTGGVCVGRADIVALSKRSGVARIDIGNGDELVCAAQGTVTIVAPRGNAS